MTQDWEILSGDFNSHSKGRDYRELKFHILQ